MKASINASVTMGGETGTTNQSRTQDGFAGITPTSRHAVAGKLTVWGSITAGTIACLNPHLENTDKAILTWVDSEGNLKHRYNVVCAVTETDEGASSSESDSGGPAGYEVAISGGAGDDLPALDSDLTIGIQVPVNITFDFDDVDTFAVTTNVRGVVVFLDSAELEKCVIDMTAGGLALWAKSSGFPKPISGTPVTHVLIGSGDTNARTAFLPKVLCLYDATE